MVPVKKFYERLGRPAGDYSLSRRWQDVLYDKKWKRFLKISRLFVFLPFADFVLAAGSMALGNVHQDSDFDVIVGCRSGRIFTARFFSVLIFGLFGWRRRKLTHNEEAADKICFNHFVTEKSFRLSPPYNIYWQELYKNLVPVFGDPEKIAKFYSANDWAGAVYPPTFPNAPSRCKRGGDKGRFQILLAGSNTPREGGGIYTGDRRHLFKKSVFFKIFWERVLSGRLGDYLEQTLKAVQIRRIEKSLKAGSLGFQPRIKYSDEELEFHPDTKRISTLISAKYKALRRP